MNWEQRQNVKNSLLSSYWGSQSCLFHHRHVYDSIYRARIRNLQLCGYKDVLSRHQTCVHSLDIDKIDQKFMLSGAYNGTIALYDFDLYKRRADGREIYKPINMAQLGGALISSMQWYPIDCGLFLASDLKGNLALFDTETCRIALQTVHQTQKIFSARFHPNISKRSLVATAVDDGSIRLWDFLSGDTAHSIVGHKSEVASVDWHPFYEHQLLSASMDGTVKLWDIRKAGATTPILSLDWRADHTYLAEKYVDRLAGGQSAQPRYHHSLSGTKPSKQSSNLSYGVAHDSAVMAARFSSCGLYLLTAGNDGKMRLWSSQSGRLLPIHYNVSCHSQLPFRIEISTLNNPNDDLVFFPDLIKAKSYQQQPEGAGLGTVGQLAIVPLHSSTGEPIHKLTGHFAGINAIAYRQSTQQVISAGKDKLLLLWEAAAEDKQAAWREEEEERQREKKRMEDSLAAASASSSVHIRPPYAGNRTQMILAQAHQHEQDHANSIRGAAMANSTHSSSSSSTAVAGSSSSRVFVPPIIRQYREEALRAQKRGAQEMQASMDLTVPARSTSRTVDWNSIDDLFAAVDENK